VSVDLDGARKGSSIMTRLLTAIDANEAQITALNYGCVEEANIIREYVVEMLCPDKRTPALPMPMVEQWTWAACLVGVVACLA
jgi:hypothetical protein